LDLLRTEGRHLVWGILSASMGLVLVAVSGVLVLAGFTMLMWGVFLAVSHSWGRTPAAFATGLLALALAGGVLWIVTRVWK
jgi:hypothetical protein